ncbi:2-isopropylmalate synthase [Candidatus Carsonella ruddii]|uniref:2-isopropylmalate synthase n=1 Tax=Carsonella ruddii TaxID=114186 RepID=A0AAE7G5F4_CARRU|nr:2-isopropylmalate synthase [Candidatus Carsonella ruddii]QLK14064.1 2-isopropylmalate synthase [Candidatus Carsonella ruddii]
MLNWNCNYICKSPIWVSEDLRDGNQSLINGYDIKKKIKIWNFLLEIGFKQIVLGFPSSNKHDFNFIKYLIKNKLIPLDVTISILTPNKKNLIDLSFNSVEKIENVIFHLYNSISKNQRKIVFKLNKKKIINFSLNGIKYIISKINKNKKKSILQYSPESFSDSEVFFSKKISYYFSYLCFINKIKSILNLPMTVENCFPHYYLNTLSYIKKNIFNTILSTHIHNDMNGAITTSMLSLLTGVSRIEGTVFGNGERAGNASIFILASNILNLGINPNINIYNKKIQFLFKNEKINLLNRFPWFSRLNYTAFSGSHQDAIFKSFYIKKLFSWKIIYLPLNPKKFGFLYKNIIKINSQSGKGGLRFIYWYNFNLLLNKIILKKIYIISQDISEILMCEIYKEFLFSIIHLRSNNLFIEKFIIIEFYYSLLFNFKIIVVLIKKKKKKIFKFIIIKNE